MKRDLIKTQSARLPAGIDAASIASSGRLLRMASAVEHQVGWETSLAIAKTEELMPWTNAANGASMDISNASFRQVPVQSRQKFVQEMQRLTQSFGSQTLVATWA